MDGKGSISTSMSANAIFILGPSSSGKTTLCGALASELGVSPPRYIKEVARNVMRTCGFTRKDTDTYEMQHAIISAQLDAEVEVLRMAPTDIPGGVLLLSDRSAIDPIVYAATSTASGAPERHERLMRNVAFQAILPFYRQSLFVVLSPVAEWMMDDGVRSLEDPWRYNEELYRTLNELEIPFIIIGEETRDIQIRVELVKRHLTITNTSRKN